MSARTVIELHAHSGIQSRLFRITVDGEERATGLEAHDAEQQLARITERMRSREGPLSVIRHANTLSAACPASAPCSWVPPECMALFDVEIGARSVEPDPEDEAEEAYTDD